MSNEPDDAKPIEQRNADALAALDKWQDDGSPVSHTAGILNHEADNLLADLANADLPAMYASAAEQIRLDEQAIADLTARLNSCRATLRDNGIERGPGQ